MSYRYTNNRFNTRTNLAKETILISVYNVGVQCVQCVQCRCTMCTMCTM